ncbi:hypothetical protein KC325_g199 [Hortaea werneckii]|nr:hypothetical protein KC325_g199 [Hortaea werneckii]
MAGLIASTPSARRCSLSSSSHTTSCSSMSYSTLPTAAWACESSASPSLSSRRLTSPLSGCSLREINRIRCLFPFFI